MKAIDFHPDAAREANDMVDERMRFEEAVWAGDLPVVEAMLATGADPNAAAVGDRLPPLLLAMERSWTEIVRRLIAAGADINRDFGQGWTPLVHAIEIESDTACQAGLPPDTVSTALLELLLAAGAKPTERAFESAAAYRNHKAILLLERASHA